MCPTCIDSATIILAGAGSTGGILALCIGKFRKFFRSSAFGLFQTSKETVNVQLSSAVLREGTRNGRNPYELG
jgi:hypothetical protein